VVAYFEKFLVYIRNFPFVSCKKKENPFDSKIYYIILLCEYVFEKSLQIMLFASPLRVLYEIFQTVKALQNIGYND
jgi:hypothetical protein